MNRRILRLALPSIAANITTPLLGLVDTAITGHMGSARYIAAIAVGGVMFNMIYWLFGFLRAGTSGLSSQAFGSGNSRDSALVLYRSLLLGITVGALMVALQVPLAELLIAIVSPDAGTEPLARQYFTILIWGAPATLATFSLTGWFLGMQNSKINLWISLIINLTNIFASLTLVYGFGFKVGGVASGTLFAQWAGLIAALLFLRGFRPIQVSFSDILRWNEIKSFFKVNVFIMLRTLFIILITVWFTRVGAEQGSVILAVNTMLMQLFMLFSYFMDGFAYAAEALVGRYAGANRCDEQKRCVSALFRWGWGMAFTFTLLYFFCGEYFLGMLSSDVGVIEASLEYWLWAVTIPFTGFAGFLWDGVYVGLVMVRDLLVITVVAAAVFFLSLLLFYHTLGNHGLWLSFILYAASRGLMQWPLYRFRLSSRHRSCNGLPRGSRGEE